MINKFFSEILSAYAMLATLPALHVTRNIPLRNPIS